MYFDVEERSFEVAEALIDQTQVLEVSVAKDDMSNLMVTPGAESAPK